MLRYPFIFTVMLLVCGCMTTTVELPTTQFPVPLMEKLPLRMGLYLPEPLLAYEFSEDLGEAGKFEIEIGDAQQAMFVNLLSGMFDQVIEVDSATPATPLTDAILVPNIAEMQFSTPQQTRTDYFEVWIRYQFQLFSPDGTVIAEWPLTAYGKANTQNYMLASTAPTLRQAAMNACRDAMAFFTVQFHTVPPIRQWLTVAVPQGERRSGT